MLIGVISTSLKSLAMPMAIIIYGEFTSLLVDRQLGIEGYEKNYTTGPSSDTIFLKIFNGGEKL